MDYKLTILAVNVTDAAAIVKGLTIIATRVVANATEVKVKATKLTINVANLNHLLSYPLQSRHNLNVFFIFLPIFMLKIEFLTNIKNFTFL